MTLEEVYQSCANVEYCLTIDNLDLIEKEDLRKMIDFIYNESIHKEKVREKIKERENKKENAGICLTSALFERDINLLEELLGE